MSKKFKTIASMHFCDGKLSYKLPVVYSNEYYISSSGSTPSFVVVFRQKSRERIVQSLEDFKIITSECNLPLIDVVRGAEGTFAEIIAPLLGNVGVVLKKSRFFEFLEKKYGIIVSQNIPRIENDVLRFLCNGPWGREPATQINIFEIFFNLNSFDLKIENIIRE